MRELLNISSEKAAAIRFSTRVLFLLLGVSIIIMELAFPPVKTLWFATGNILGAVLIIFSIIGLSPRLKISGFGKVIQNTSFHVATSFLIGMGVIIAAMINPPVHMIWFAFFNFIGIALVVDSVITSSWNGSKAKYGSGEKEVVSEPEDSTHFHPHV